MRSRGGSGLFRISLDLLRSPLSTTCRVWRRIALKGVEPECGPCYKSVSLPEILLDWGEATHCGVSKGQAERGIGVTSSLPRGR